MDRLDDRVHDGRWQDYGIYRVISGGRLIASSEDITGRKVLGGRVVVEGKLGGERREAKQ